MNKIKYSPFSLEYLLVCIILAFAGDDDALGFVKGGAKVSSICEGVALVRSKTASPFCLGFLLGGGA